MDFIFDPSLVLYLPLYKLDGASFMSRDAYGHLCTVTGAVWRPDGRTFDGDDKIAIDAASTLQSLTTGSIEVWGKIASLEASKGLFSAGDVDDATSYIGLYFSTAAGGVMYAICYNDGIELYNDLFPNAIPTAGRWHHYVLVQDGVEPVLYMDMVKYAIGGVRPDDTGWFADVLNIDTVLVGQMVNQAWGNLTGNVGEVRIYNRALTPLEIQHNYLATKWRYR